MGTTFRRVLTALGVLGILFLSGCLRPGGQNESPVADFEHDPQEGYVPLVVRFDASASFDPDGQILSYAWDFGDGETAEGVIVEHTYTAPGEYVAKLTVRDDKGAEDTAEATVTALEPPENATPPVARFTYSPQNPKVGETITFDASSSTDDGEIVEYRWNFGDSTFGTGITVTHVYTKAGTYQVRLTVYDDEGLAGQQSQEIVVSERPNQSPVARFTYSPTNPAAGSPVTFDASSSTDPDGTIAEYHWAFGDGKEGTGQVVQHVFYVPGAYTVRLTVKDDRGATASTEAQVTVGPPGPPPPPPG